MEEIILIGGGGHCKSVIDVIEQEGKFNIAGIVDKEKLLGSKVLGYPIIGSDLDLLDLSKKYKNALITIGQIKSPDLRIKLYEKTIKAGFLLPTIVSPRAYISKYASIGAGNVIMHGVLINADAEIGSNCIINTKALIEHDCKISDHCHISTNVVLNGDVIVERGCFIGSQSVVKERSHIKLNSIYTYGSVIK